MGNVIYDKSFKYAVEIVKLSKEIRKVGEYELAKQLLRCSTAIGANISESEYAQSKADFITKLTIALKETAESHYWIKLLTETGYIEEKISKDLTYKVEEIIKILVASIKTAKERT